MISSVRIFLHHVIMSSNFCLKYVRQINRLTTTLRLTGLIRRHIIFYLYWCCLTIQSPQNILSSVSTKYKMQFAGVMLCDTGHCHHQVTGSCDQHKEHSQNSRIKPVHFRLEKVRIVDTSDNFR